MSNKNQNSKTGLFLGALIFGGLGIFLLFSSIQNLKMVHASKSWPHVQGAVVSSNVVRVLKSTDKKGKRHYSYKGDVRYNYRVEGQEYLSGRISFGDYSTNTPAHAQEVVAEYPVGKKVQVYFDPDAPMHSVLERKAGFTSFLYVGLGLLFALGGLALLFLFFVKLFTGR
ncbi:MAG: hypothetical protein DRJ08_02130 [Acidobacteria bacterium]|nr:MAG: hypothetical protein DRJ08_02130 [Acidobacteriota bacterium]